ncbi:unnamed protein product [Heligmosomoides polygyrus]|uniref:Uncharacterized protein n=1 Tax=Heligmosomoides polygyrus TaxID=6339 RepID=A0A183GI45_HELPZ|nr:unnamed protein product [Heligmosomoides polygyrus]
MMSILKNAFEPSSSMNGVVALERRQPFKTSRLRTGRGHHVHQHCQALVRSLHQKRNFRRDAHTVKDYAVLDSVGENPEFSNCGLAMRQKCNTR